MGALALLPTSSRCNSRPLRARIHPGAMRPSRWRWDTGIFSLAPWDPGDRTPGRSAALKRCSGTLERLAMGMAWEWRSASLGSSLGQPCP